MRRREISRFRGEHAFLSNFHPSTVRLPGEPWPYPTVEHAFQAAKADTEFERRCVQDAETPAEAKRRGRRIDLRPGWEEDKYAVMEGLLRQKFWPGTDLAKRLLETGGAKLVEGNSWGDTTWGVCKGVGHNALGRLLMRIRKDLRGWLHDVRPVEGYEGLGQCAKCGAAECEIPTSCPGKAMTAREKQAVCDGELDFVAGEWTDPRTGNP